MGARKQTSPSEKTEWLHVAVRYLARWDRSIAQVEQFLLAKGATPAQVRQTISRLRDLRYLDDQGFAERWIEGRLARQPMGRERLRAELQAKGVDESVAEGALAVSLDGVDEETLARQVLKVTQRRGRQLTPMQMARLLRQRGFEDETIDRIIGPMGLD